MIMLVGVLDAKKCKSKQMLICQHSGSSILLKDPRWVLKNDTRFSLVEWFTFFLSVAVIVNIQIDSGTIPSNTSVKNLEIFIAWNVKKRLSLIRFQVTLKRYHFHAGILVKGAQISSIISWYFCRLLFTRKKSGIVRYGWCSKLLQSNNFRTMCHKDFRLQFAWHHW